MKKTKGVLVVFLFLSLTAWSQTKSKKVDISWGQPEKESKKMTLSDIAGYDDTGIYAVKTKQKGFNQSITLEHYDNEMNPVKAVELDLKYKKKERSFEFIVQLHNELFLFTSFKNQKLKRNFLFVQGINKKTLQLKNDLKKIAEINYTGKWKFNAGNYNYALSRDSSKLLIYYNLPYTRGDAVRFGFHVLDADMNEVWEKSVALPYQDELLGVEDYEVDNEGNVFLLGIIYKGIHKDKRQGKPNFKYQILNYYDKGEELKQYPVLIEGKFLTDMKIAINRNQDIICAGFYSDEGTWSIKGSYFLRIDGQTKEIVSKSFKEFGIDFITQNMTVRKENKKEGGEREKC